MKFPFSKFLKTLVFFLILSTGQSSFGQDGDDLPPTDDPVVAAPIDDWVPFFFIAGLVFAWGVYKKRVKTTSN